MITQDFYSYPEHRKYFFILVQSMSQNCFEVFFNINEQIFTTIINCIVWAFKHEETEIQIIGLETLKLVLENLNNHSQFRDKFYQIYFETLLTELLFVFTDGLHKNSFEKIADTLKTFIKVSEFLTYQIDATQPNNLESIKKKIVEIMSNAFQNLSVTDHEQLVSNIILNYN